MDDTKLKKIGAELSKARAKRDEWDRKVKDLERRYREAENTCIHDIGGESPEAGKAGRRLKQ